MKLILISSPENFSNEINLLVELFELGLQCFHLRKPDSSSEEINSYLKKIPAHFHSRIVIHQHYQLSSVYGIKGIHLKEKERELYIHKNQSTLNAILSTSFHKLEDLEANKYLYQYAFFSPVFTSISKHEHQPIYTLNELKLGLQKAKIPIIALGGVDATKLKQLKDVGFSGIACLGAIWNTNNPVAAFRQLKNKLKY